MSNIVKKENVIKGSLSKLQKLGNLTTNISGKIELPRMFYQLVIFVIDASNSMHEHSKNKREKAEEIEITIKSIIDRLKRSKNKNDFDISFVAFSNDYNDSFGLKKVSDITEDISYNPFDYISEARGTKMAGALEYIKKISEEYLNTNSNKPSQVLIQILSDGAIDDYNKSLELITD